MTLDLSDVRLEDARRERRVCERSLAIADRDLASARAGYLRAQASTGLNRNVGAALSALQAAQSHRRHPASDLATAKRELADVLEANGACTVVPGESNTADADEDRR